MFLFCFYSVESMNQPRPLVCLWIPNNAAHWMFSVSACLFIYFMYQQATAVIIQMLLVFQQYTSTPASKIFTSAWWHIYWLNTVEDFNISFCNVWTNFKYRLLLLYIKSVSLVCPSGRMLSVQDSYTTMFTTSMVEHTHNKKNNIINLFKMWK